MADHTERTVVVADDAISMIFNCHMCISQQPFFNSGAPPSSHIESGLLRSKETPLSETAIHWAIHICNISSDNEIWF